MKKNVSFKRVSFWVVFFMAAVFNLSCDNGENDPIKYDQTSTTSVEKVAKPKGAEQYNFTVRRDSVNYGKKTIMSWTTFETTTNVEAKSQMTVEASHAFDKNAVLDEDRNKVIDVAYAQAHTTYSEVKANKTIGYVQNNYTYSQRATALLGDGGTQCYLDMEAVIPQMNLGEKFYEVAADSIIFGKAYVKSLEFVEKTMTRAAEFYIDKEHPFFVRVVWSVPFETVNLEKNYKAEVEVSDTIMDYPLVPNDLVDVKVETNREVLDETTERGEIYLEFIHKNGEIDKANVIIPMRYGVKTIPEYLKDVSNFDHHHTRDNDFIEGSPYTPTDMQQDYVTYSERVIKFSTDATNGAEPINAPYEFYSQKARFYRKYGNFVVDKTFDFILPEMNEKTTYVLGVESNDSKFDMARFYNKINVTYQGFYQEAQETVLLRKKAEGVEWEGFESLDGTRTIFNDSIVWIPRYRKDFRDGSSVRSSARHSDVRLHEILSDWLSTEENESQTTNNLWLGDPSYQKMSVDIDGFRFEWERETRYGESNAKLFGSTQNNKGRFIEPVRMTVTYLESGKSVTYTDLVVNTSNSASVSGGAESEGYKWYDYRDQWTYKLGDNTLKLVAPGLIKVKMADPDPTITFKGFTTYTINVYNDGRIVRKAEHLKQWSNGKEERKNFTLTTNWGVNATTSWNSIEANKNQSTTSATQNITSRNTETKKVDGATFTFVRVNATAKSTAKLAGSNQQNGWTLVYEEGASSISYDGDVANFDNLSFNISNAASVTGGNENGGYYVYNYADKLGANLNGQTQYASAPGLIKVKVKEPTFFPEEWGEIVAAVQTVANNESHKSYVYTWSLRFKNNYVLPVVVRPGSSTPEYHFEYVEKTSITTYNGGTYEAATNKWINTTAQDEPMHMIWSRNHVECANQGYQEAKSQHWDEDHFVNGKPSVHTNRYSLTINNGKLTAKDTYENKMMGTWSSYVGD